MKEGVTIIVGAICLFLAIIFWNDISGAFSSNKGKKSEVKVKGEKKIKGSNESDADQVQGSDGNVQVLQRWDMPEKLKEISGLSYIDKDRFACVQDELGTLFVYNIASQKIEREITFAGTGDFEGVVWTDDKAYVIRADGKLFIISNVSQSKPTVIEIETGLTIKNDVESLGYDKKNNRLLMTGKEPDRGTSSGKAIYAFDLASQKMIKNPVMTIDLSASSTGSKGKKSGNNFHPSSLEIHPVNGNIYLIDGPGSNLLIVDGSGAMKSFISLGSRDFPQPEGITFNPEGDIFISTEGKKDPGAIMKVAIPNP